MSDKVIIRTDMREHPNLRKLARALLRLARHQLQAPAIELSESPAKVVKPDSGDGA